MKIGILTFHYALNYGAVLQAYALKTALGKMGHSVEVIHYVNSKMRAELSPFYIPPNQNIVNRILCFFRIPMYKKMGEKFKHYIGEHLSLSGEMITSIEKLKKLSENYDRIISGSDQVFNYIGTGEDFNFYLDFVDDDRKKMAYAPSFGLSEIDEAHREHVCRCLEHIPFLTVREEKGKELIFEMTGKMVPVVCDPTFLLSTEEWLALQTSFPVKRPYVLIYSFGSRHLEDSAWSLAKHLNVDVVNINRIYFSGVRGKAKNAYAPDPSEFLFLIKNAEYVVTNSFHGTALSLLLEKNVYVAMNSYDNSIATNNRFVTLLNKLELSDRIFSPNQLLAPKAIDYKRIRPKIEFWRRECLNLLSESLNIEENR